MPGEITWEPQSQGYQLGVDRGIIQRQDGPVLPWNGLLKVSEGEQESSEVHSDYDGLVYANFQFGGVFSCKVESISFPETLIDLLGQKEVFPGMTLSNQLRESFNFSYRTLVGDSGYKIHIVYNATGSRDGVSAKTIKRTYEPEQLTLSISTLPVLPDDSTIPATSHVIIDTTKVSPEIVAEIELALYGDELTDPTFISLDEIVSLS